MLEYRKATIDDAGELARVRADFLSDTRGSPLPDSERAQLILSGRQYFLQSLADGSFAAWLAVEDGEIAGTSGVTFFALPPKVNHSDLKAAYISNMFTYPEHRKRGIASKLFALTVETALECGCSKISLNATDMGRPIYEKYGFINNIQEMFYYV